MKQYGAKKACAWLLINIIFFSPTINAFQEEGVVIDENEFPMLQLIQNLDQVDTPFGMDVKQKLYDIGEKVWLISQKTQIDNAVQGLQGFDQPEFQNVVAAINNYHGFLHQAYEDGIPQTEAALYSALRNREYADRFGFPVIGIAGLGAGYGSAVVRSRMMARFIEMLALSGLGFASSKLEKAALYTFIGILTTACLGTIFYHWRKYNKLYTEKQKNKLELKLTTKHDKKIKRLESEHVTELENVNAQLEKNNKNLAKFTSGFTQKLTKLETHQIQYSQNISTQLNNTMANQTALKEQLKEMINSQNHLIESVNQTWGALAVVNTTGTGHINQQQLQQFRLATVVALRQFDAQIKKSNKRHTKIFNKFKTIGRRKSKSTSPLLPLTPRNPNNASGSSYGNTLVPALIISLPEDTK